MRGWLAKMTHQPIDAVAYVRETERSGRRTVIYDCAGVTAKVRMSPVAGAAAWEVVAEVGGAVDRVVLPASTRFIWRKPRGTHV